MWRTESFIQENIYVSFSVGRNLPGIIINFIRSWSCSDWSHYILIYSNNYDCFCLSYLQKLFNMIWFHILERSLFSFVKSRIQLKSFYPDETFVLDALYKKIWLKFRTVISSYEYWGRVSQTEQGWNSFFLSK